MEAKTLILSSSGLKNVIFSKTKNVEDKEDFCFILGNEELKTNYLFAEFISPRVSKIHQTDPTMNYFNLTKSFNRYNQHQNQDQSETKTKQYKTLLEQVDELSRGNMIEISYGMLNSLEQISIILGNSELFTKLNELFPENDDDERINKSLISLKLNFYGFENDVLEISNEKEKTSIIDFIASRFYKIGEEKLLQIPKQILEKIVSNEHLKLKDEDSLLDFIDKLFENDNDEDKEDKMKFYENVEFKSLSEEKMQQFIYKLNPDEMTNTIWHQLIECFYSNRNIVKTVKTVEERMSEHRSRYCKFDNETQPSNKYKTIEYDSNKNDRFKGIIYELSHGNPLNIINDGIIDVSSSSSSTSSNFQLNYVFNFNDDKKGFHSQSEPNSWFCYDFKERKLKLSHYSLRSHAHGGKYNCRVKTWIIEGSNDKENWKTIDERSNEESVVDVSASNTFKIETNKSTNDFYRFIRIRQTDVNSSHSNSLVFSVMEFFGTILEP